MGFFRPMAPWEPRFWCFFQSLLWRRLAGGCDRLVYGRVADFFHFYFRGYDWYVFNIADCAITFGVGALLYDALLRPEQETAPQRHSPGATDVE